MYKNHLDNNMSSSPIENPIAESTCINGTSRMGGKNFWNESNMRVRNSPNHEASSRSVRSGLLKLRGPGIEPRVYLDAVSNGLTSRITKYHEDSASRSNLSMRNLYNKPGDFPVIHLRKVEHKLKVKKNRDLSVTKIPPPRALLYNGSTIPGLWRSSSLDCTPQCKNDKTSRENIPIMHPPATETELKPTRSVLEVLREISRKRIICDQEQGDSDMDIPRKYCKNTDIDSSRGAASSSSSNKRPRESQTTLPINSEASPELPPTKKRVNDYTGEIWSSYSSSMNAAQRKLLEMRIFKRSRNEVPAPSNDKPPTVSRSTTPHVVEDVANIPNSVPRENTPLIVQPSICQDEAKYSDEAAQEKSTNKISSLDPKQKLTLFNASVSNLSRQEGTSDNVPSNNEYVDISFVKAKKVISNSGTELVNKMKKSKLALMLKALKGELDEESGSDNDLEEDESKRNTDMNSTRDTNHKLGEYSTTNVSLNPTHTSQSAEAKGLETTESNPKTTSTLSSTFATVSEISSELNKNTQPNNITSGTTISQPTLSTSASPVVPAQTTSTTALGNKVVTFGSVDILTFKPQSSVGPRSILKTSTPSVHSITSEASMVTPSSQSVLHEFGSTKLPPKSEVTGASSSTANSGASINTKQSLFQQPNSTPAVEQNSSSPTNTESSTDAGSNSLSPFAVEPQTTLSSVIQKPLSSPTFASVSTQITLAPTISSETKQLESKTTQTPSTTGNTNEMKLNVDSSNTNEAKPFVFGVTPLPASSTSSAPATEAMAFTNTSLKPKSFEFTTMQTPSVAITASAGTGSQPFSFQSAKSTASTILDQPGSTTTDPKITIDSKPFSFGLNNSVTTSVLTDQQNFTTAPNITTTQSKPFSFGLNNSVTTSALANQPNLTTTAPNITTTESKPFSFGLNNSVTTSALADQPNLTTTAPKITTTESKPFSFGLNNSGTTSVSMGSTSTANPTKSGAFTFTQTNFTSQPGMAFGATTMADAGQAMNTTSNTNMFFGNSTMASTLNNNNYQSNDKNDASIFGSQPNRLFSSPSQPTQEPSSFKANSFGIKPFASDSAAPSTSILPRTFNFSTSSNQSTNEGFRPAESTAVTTAAPSVFSPGAFSPQTSTPSIFGNYTTSALGSSTVQKGFSFPGNDKQQGASPFAFGGSSNVSTTNTTSPFLFGSNSAGSITSPKSIFSSPQECTTGQMVFDAPKPFNAFGSSLNSQSVDENTPFNNNMTNNSNNPFGSGPVMQFGSTNAAANTNVFGGAFANTQSAGFSNSASSPPSAFGTSSASPPFAFGSTATNNTSTGANFVFGSGSLTNNSNPRPAFGNTQSTWNNDQPAAPFSFGAPNNTENRPFNFGATTNTCNNSQPANNFGGNNMPTNQQQNIFSFNASNSQSTVGSDARKRPFKRAMRRLQK